MGNKQDGTTSQSAKAHGGHCWSLLLFQWNSHMFLLHMPKNNWPLN